MEKSVLYATSNPGKILEVRKHLEYNGISVISPNDLGIDLDVEETGQTFRENAILKVNAYRKLVPDRLILSDDSGILIDSLDGEPGIHTRRWKDGKTRMEDDEIIQYCLEKMSGIPKEKRGGQFKSVIALSIPGQETEIFEGILDGIIMEQPSEVVKIEGFPFEGIFYVPEWGKLTGEVAILPAKEKEHLLNHREKALTLAISRIRELLK